jgi:hypothetical protein
MDCTTIFKIEIANGSIETVCTNFDKAYDNIRELQDIDQYERDQMRRICNQELAGSMKDKYVNIYIRSIDKQKCYRFRVTKK